MRVGSRVRGEPKESNRKAAHYSIITKEDTWTGIYVRVGGDEFMEQLFHPCNLGMDQEARNGETIVCGCV